MKPEYIFLNLAFGLILTFPGGHASAKENVALGQVAGFGDSGAKAPTPVAAVAPAAAAAAAAGPSFSLKRANQARADAKAAAELDKLKLGDNKAAGAANTPAPNPIKEFIAEHKVHIVMGALGAYLGFVLLGPVGILLGAAFMIGAVMLAS